jgi:hypothetical protein
MSPNIFGTFFNNVEKISTENSFSGTPGNISEIEESGIQINNKPATVITQMGLKAFMV